MNAKVEAGYIDLSNVESLSAVRQFLLRGGFVVEEHDFRVLGEGIVLRVRPCVEDPDA